jgi:hypothetical protein
MRDRNFVVEERTWEGSMEKNTDVFVLLAAPSSMWKQKHAWTATQLKMVLSAHRSTFSHVSIELVACSRFVRRILTAMLQATSRRCPVLRTEVKRVARPVGRLLRHK